MYAGGNIFDIYRKIGKKLPFFVMRTNFFDRPKNLRTYLVERIEARGKYGIAYGKAYINGKPDESYRQKIYPELTNGEIPNAGCDGWVLVENHEEL